MKQQDLIVIGVIVFIAGIFSYFISTKFITPSTEKLKAETVSAIDTTFSVPDSSVFNDKAINPTVDIKITPKTNKKPFTETSQ